MGRKECTLTMVPFEPASTVPARHWHTLSDGRVQCDICPRFCKLRDGQRGLCFVRGAQNNRLVLTTYGRSSGFCVDPIEKKPLNQFLPGTAVLSFGTAGCNLSCSFCQNWDITKSREMDSLADQASPETIAKAAVKLGCASVAMTYNDPVIYHEYAVDTARACHERGVATVAVTAGYQCAAPRAEFYEHMDAANIDLKAFSDSFYRELTGSRLEPVLETLKYVARETDVWLEVTTLLIPGHNDSERELRALTGWFVKELGPDVPLHFSAFHPDWRMRDHAATPLATVQRAREIARVEGVRFVYTGNVHDRVGDTTFCSGCQGVLIERDWYEIRRYRLDSSGRCPNCGTRCPGHYQAAAGSWGRRRRAVRLSDFC